MIDRKTRTIPTTAENSSKLVSFKAFLADAQLQRRTKIQKARLEKLLQEKRR